MNRVLPASLLAAILAGCAMKTEKFVAYTYAPARFTAEVPSDWTVIPNPAGDTPGTQFLSPKPSGARAVRPYISVDFYTTDNARYASLAACLVEGTREQPGRSHGPIAAIQVGSLTGQEYTLIRPLPQTPQSAPKGRLSERTVLLSVEDGFYELCFTAPEESTAAHAEAFNRFLETFRRQ